MSRVYKSNWSPQKLVVNFNQKQWRQDLASFIVNRLYWSGVRVGKSRIIEQGTKFSDGVREFEIYDGHNVCNVKYSNKNEIISTSHPEVVQEYMLSKGM